MLLLCLPAGCGFGFELFRAFCLFLRTTLLDDFVTGFIFNNMSRMHLSDAEAGVNPLFEKNVAGGT